MKRQLHQNIWCVGRNYLDHAKEMQSEVPKVPLFFLKSGASLNPSPKIELPNWSNEIHYELEAAFLLDENLCFSHISLALDLTARDIQTTAKKAGHPWTLAKSFKDACPVGSWLSLDGLYDVLTLDMKLIVNNAQKQSSPLSAMIFKPEQLLDYAKQHFPLQPHDIILTGTPAGVGPLRLGDSLEATLSEGKRTLLTCLWDVV